MTTRSKIGQVLERPLVTDSMLGMILFNTMPMGIETSDTVMAQAGGLKRLTWIEPWLGR